MDSGKKGANPVISQQLRFHNFTSPKRSAKPSSSSSAQNTPMHNNNNNNPLTSDQSNNISNTTPFTPSTPFLKSSVPHSSATDISGPIFTPIKPFPSQASTDDTNNNMDNNPPRTPDFFAKSESTDNQTPHKDETTSLGAPKPAGPSQMPFSSTPFSNPGNNLANNNNNTNNSTTIDSTGFLTKLGQLALAKLAAAERFSLEDYELWVDSLVAIDSRNGFLWAIIKNSLWTLDLGLLKEKGTPHWQKTKLAKVELNSPRQLIFNSTFKYLLIVESKKCYVLENNRRLINLLGTHHEAQQEIVAQCVEIGANFHRIYSSVIVLKARWHPLSPSHLVLLTSDNTLRIFDVLQNCSEAEQTWRLGFCQKNEKYIDELPRVVDFWFGAEGFEKFGNLPVLNWEIFTIYFLLQNGSIRYLSPVVPYNCVLPAEFLDTTEVEILLEEAREMGDKRSEKMYLQQKKWLQSVSGDRLLNLDMTMIESFDADADPVSLIKTRAPLGETIMLNLQTISLERLPKSVNDKKGEFCGLSVVVTPLATMLFRVQDSGLIEIFLTVEKISPSWQNLTADEKTVCVSFERIPLSIPSSSGLPWPVLEFSTIERHVMYLRHAGGIHRISVMALLQLLEYDSLDDSTTLPKFTKSTVDFLLNTMPLKNSEPNPIVGFACVDDPFLGSWLLCVEASFRVRCFDLQLVAKRAAVSLLEFGEDRENAAPSPVLSIQPFKVELDAFRRRQPNLTLLSSRTKTPAKMDSPETLDFLLRAKKEADQYTLWLEGFGKLINSRISTLENFFLDDLIKSQVAKLMKITQLTAQEQEHTAAKQLSITRKQEEQSRRLSALIRKFHQSEKNIVSKAETQFRKELVEKRNSLVWLQAQVKELEEDTVLTLHAKQHQPTSISREHAKHIFVLLEAQKNFLEEAREKIAQIKKEAQII